mgnify:CR=1 FL=1
MFVMSVKVIKLADTGKLKFDLLTNQASKGKNCYVMQINAGGA